METIHDQEIVWDNLDIEKLREEKYKDPAAYGHNKILSINKKDYHYQDFGTISIDDLDGMFIPVNCKIYHQNFWVWRASCFLPRIASIDQHLVFIIHADDRETLLAVVNHYVTPLYYNAFNRIRLSGECIYWVGSSADVENQSVDQMIKTPKSKKQESQNSNDYFFYSSNELQQKSCSTDEGKKLLIATLKSKILRYITQDNLRKHYNSIYNDVFHQDKFGQKFRKLESDFESATKEMNLLSEEIITLLKQIVEIMISEFSVFTEDVSEKTKQKLKENTIQTINILLFEFGLDQYTVNHFNYFMSIE